MPSRHKEPMLIRRTKPFVRSTKRKIELMLERHPAITNAKTNHWNITPILSFRNIEMACTFTVSTTPTRELRPNSTKLIVQPYCPTTPRTLPSAAAENVEPSPPAVQEPEKRIRRPVSVQMTIVSMKVSMTAHIPCCAGWSMDSACDCIVAEAPRPASLEKTPRARPLRMVADTAAPAKPPMAAWPVNAPLKMEAKTAPMLPMFAKTTISAQMM